MCQKLKTRISNRKLLAIAWSWKGWYIFIMGKLELAKKCYDKATELDPKNFYGWWGKFWTHFILGKVADFQESADKLTEIIPENEYAWSIKGWTHFILGKVEKSLECYEKYIEIRKRNQKGHLSGSDNEWTVKGYLLHILERFDDAMKCADKALEVDQTDKYALVLKGEILNSHSEHDEAIKYYDKVICKNGKDSWHSYVLTLKGNALSSLGKYDEAVICYLKSLEHNYYPAIVLINKTGTLSSKNDADAWFKKVSSLADLDGEVILASFDKLLENAPNNAYAWNSKGNILSNLGRYKEGIKCYDKAIELDPNYALAIANKDNVLSNLNKSDKNTITK